MTAQRDEPSDEEERLLDDMRTALKTLGFESDLGISRVIEPEDPDLVLRTWRSGGPLALRQLLESPPFSCPAETIDRISASAREHWGPPGPDQDKSST
jgi:hypothetical protein